MPESRFTQTVHMREPDYSREQYQLPVEAKEKIFKRLSFLYGETTAAVYMPELERILRVYHACKSESLLEKEKDFNPEERFTQEDIILITYGDLIQEEGKSPLKTLSHFCDIYLQGGINTVHILPFFPYSSDRGFSIVDFETVDPRLGTWEDIEELENHYQLMFDGVINHVSSKSRWFHEFQNNHPYYKDFFISYGSPEELTPEERMLIFRPRTSDILTRIDTLNGPKFVWTTFSDDQIDLNYKNPNVLIRVLEILLVYVKHGADIIRLDAVTYLWAEKGTRCIHLEQTHEIVKLFRDILNTVAPGVAIITETNVPHEENISYFGDGNDEAQMVYNFALPPLVLHTFYTEDSSVLSRWAKALDPPSKTTTFFNFLDSHDGIGVMAVKNILLKENIDYIVEKAQARGGYVSYKTTGDGSEEPYEINITWFSALNDENNEEEDVAFQVKRFVASRTVALVLKGVPGIYLHSLIGTKNDINAVLQTHSKRDINRTVIDGLAIKEALGEPLSKISRINREFGRLITIRTKKRAFHPNGPQKILMLQKEIFTVVRITPEGDECIISLINVSNTVTVAELKIEDLPFHNIRWFDLVSKMEWMAHDGLLHFTMQPYDIIWLEPFKEQ